jgi:Raf kinase inhibitor-like YbhB/YbcL family protein
MSSKRSTSSPRPGKRTLRLALDTIVRPHGEWRVCGDEIAADLGFGLPMGSFVRSLTVGPWRTGRVQAERTCEMKVASPAFDPGGTIPSKYTCDGDDISPPIEWSDLPAGTQSVALVCDDPDAPRGTFVHWVLFNVPSNVTRLPEHVATTRELPDGSRQGKNDFGKVGYGGPCPPSGTHRYRFTLYALDRTLELASGSTGAELETATKNHVLATAQVTGSYARGKRK